MKEAFINDHEWAGDHGHAEFPLPAVPNPLGKPRTMPEGDPAIHDFGLGSSQGIHSPTYGGHKGAVYLSGPITDLTYSEARYGWRQYAASKLAPGISPLSPMRHEGHLAERLGPITDGEGLEAAGVMSKIKTIVAKDILDMKRSDIVLCNFAGAAPTDARGTMCELGYAAGIGKTVVTVVDPNSHFDYGFITELSSIVVYNLDDAIAIINSLLSEGV